MEKLWQYTDLGIELAIAYIPKLLLAIVTLLVGLRIIRIAMRAMQHAMERANTDISLWRFLSSLISILLKLLLVLSVATMVGIQTTSFIAVLGAAGLALGLALQGSLANFAGGILILLFKPYQVGDFIEAQGKKGTVHSIQVFNTILKTPENDTVIMPNGALSNGTVTVFQQRQELARAA